MLPLLFALAIQQKHSPTVYFDPGASGPAWNGQGGIKSDDIKVEHRDANGNVEGTEFVHLEYDVSSRIVPLGPDGDYPWTYVFCTRECQGTKHKKHSECDLSCDKQCTKDHHLTMKGAYYELRNNMSQMEKESAGLNQKGSAGAAATPDWSSAVSHALKAAEKDAQKQVVDETPAHLTTPCTWDDRTYGYHTSQFQVKAVMRKVGFYMSKGVKTPIDSVVGTQEGAVCLLYYPSKDPLSEFSLTFCKCERFVFPKTPPDPGVTDGPTDGGVGWRTPGGEPVIPEDGKVEVTAHGKDLNEAEIDVENHTGGDLKVLIYPGLLLISDDDGTQTMVVLEFLSVLVPNGATTRIPVSAGPSDSYAPTAIKPHVVCTEISKHEPTPSTKMHLSAAKDDHLSQLCRMFANDNLHFGGLDQTRAWIYLSHSTRDEINQRLFPRVTAGTYLNALSDVASTGVDVEAPEYRPCTDLSLLEGATARQKAVEWFVRYWEGHDPKSLISFAGRLVDHEKQVLASGDAAETRHAAHLAAVFLTSTEPELRDAGLRILSEAVPEAKRDEVVTDGGLTGVWDSLSSGDEGEVGKALAIVDLYKAKTYLIQVSGLASYSPNANIKMAAQAVSAKLKG